VLRTGYSIVTAPDIDRPVAEYDNVSCGHCQKVIFVKAGSACTIYLIPVLDHESRAWRWTEEAGAFCRVCMRPICLTCHDQGRCRTWERQIEASEARERFLQAAGIRG
jgi:hypothetical protein